MPKLARTFLVIPLLLAGCAETPREKAESRLRKTDLARMRLEAALLYKDLFASTTPSYVTVKSSAWPATFRSLEPQQVGAYRDGFALTMHQLGGVESGIYVIPTQMEVLPESMGRARFEPIADGIYWYSFQP